MSGRVRTGVKMTAELQRAWGMWQYNVMALEDVDPVTTELVRLRAAEYHDCHT